MSILKVAQMGHPVLREQGRPLERADFGKPLLQKLIDDMIETMHEYNGVGLAAPQVHMSLRLFVVLANPEIIANANTREDGWEGCLSIPDIRGRVPRFTNVTVKGLDRDGREIELRLEKFPARVAQHETDHVDGVLFFDRMTSMESLTYLDEYSRFHSKDDD